MADTNASPAQGAPATASSKLATAADLCNKLDSIRMGRNHRERDWRLNLAFYEGRQYSYWNPNAKRIETLPTEDGEKPRYRVRIVANMISLGVQSVISKLIKTKPMFGASPGAPGDHNVKAAQFAEDLLTDWWDRLDLGSKYEEALIWAQLAENGYWKLAWDPFAAKEARYLTNPQDGQPIVDQALADEFRVQLQQRNLDPTQFEKVVYQGDVKVEVMSPFDIYLDPGAKDARDAKWVFCAHHLEPDEINVRYPKAKGLNLTPDKVAVQPSVSLPTYGTDSSIDPTLKTVYIGYFKRTPQLPNGRYVVFIEDPDTILYDSQYPYEMNELPIVQFRGIRVPGSANNNAPVSHARPIQKQINRLLSQITEYTNMVIKPRVWAPVNSLRQRLTTEPGAVYEYTPVGGMKPEIEELPSIPPYVFQFLDTLTAQLNNIFGLTDVTEGNLPPNLEAANAIDLLQEMATDRFAPTILSNEKQLAFAGQFLLTLAQKYYTEPRLLTLSGISGSQGVKEFTQADIAGEVLVRVEAGSSMPRTRAARRAQIESWMANGIISPQKAYKYYDIADVKDLAVEMSRDEDQAIREHEKLIAGVPLHPSEMQQAIQQVNQAQQAAEQGQTTQFNDPDQDGMPDATTNPAFWNEWVQQQLQKAAVAVAIQDNDDIHMDKHRAFMVTEEFEKLPPDVQQRFEDHYDAHLERKMNLIHAAEPVAPRVSLQLRGNPTPTGEAMIMRAAGIPIDPQVLASEQPIAQVTEDLADPVAETTDPHTGLKTLTEAGQAIVQSKLANADSQQSFAHKQTQHVVDTTHAVTAEQRAQELHDLQMRGEEQKQKQAEQLHHEKVRQMRKPKPKPAPQKK
jgi:hypothetical protein